MNEINIHQDRTGLGISTRRAALDAYQHSETTMLYSVNVPVARIIPPNVSVYTALLDFNSKTGGSGHIGVFTSEELARLACQEHKDEDDEVSGAPKAPLVWKDDYAEVPDGDRYVVILSSLDIPTGMG